METMTKEQIANWRKVLFQTLGSYAFIMPEDDIIKIRNNMQAHVDKGSSHEDYSS